ncbi:MAG: N-formylglutamate amidohydrolase, partial [Alphaproteobacteria bacterium]|nr:N-formylglutamate amidohydrolase [Alphaproteobacteria bacterium]
MNLYPDLMNLYPDNEPPPAGDVLNAAGSADIILICEHASNHIPAEFNNLGLSDSLLASHIAWDIGMADLTRQLSAKLDAPAILATFSRLLIDPNREDDHAGLIPTESDKVIIPGNQNLSPNDIEKRKNRYYHRFHDRIDRLIKNRISTTPLVCDMHSFTPVMNGHHRPWPVGLLWNRDPRLARRLITSLRTRGYNVGDNEPYSGRDLFFTLNRHGRDNGLRHTTIEIRQDEISDGDGID